jgi:hypothetical protein
MASLGTESPNAINSTPPHQQNVSLFHIFHSTQSYNMNCIVHFLYTKFCFYVYYTFADSEKIIVTKRGNRDC